MRDFASDRRPFVRTRPWMAAVLLAALTPWTGSAQVRDVISKEIAVGRNEASLTLELAGDRHLDIAFRDGRVRIDGDGAGRFEPGGGLESAWRELLGTAISLDDGPLARALLDWEPPSELDRSHQVLARRIDEVLESALSMEDGADASAEARALAGERMIRSLLERTDRLDELAEAMEGLRLREVTVRVGEDVLVTREMELEGTLVAVDSDVEVRGTVRGDVVVVDGTLRIPGGGRITGDVRLADSRLLDRDGEIEGSILEVEAVEEEEELRDRLRDELREELRSELRAGARTAPDRDRGWDFLRPLRDVGRGFAGALGVLLNTAALALLGWGVVFFAPDNVSVVAETVRRSPGRAGVVGLAGLFLLIPVWILGGVALILTVVGIFALPFWIVLFPLAVVAAAGLGFYGAAGGIGEHLARRRYPFLDWVRSSNTYTLVTGGLIVLAAPFLLANLVEMAVILGFIEGLLMIVGSMALVAAVCVGFGAVLITRGGRRPDFYRGGGSLDDTDWTGDPGPAAPTGGDDWFRTGPEAANPKGPDATPPTPGEEP